MNHPEEDQMITSKEVLDKTGISRATLNNYIKMGILPKPVVRKPQSGLGSVKQIGYFPVDVLNKISAVQQYKRQGYSMEKIAERLSGMSPGSDVVFEDQTAVMGDGDTQSREAIPLPLSDPPEKTTLTIPDQKNVSEQKPGRDIEDIFLRRLKTIRELFSQSMPRVVSYCVLAASLQETNKIRAELLPKDYFDLVNPLWRMVQQTVDRFKGIYGKPVDHGAVYYFLENQDPSYRMNAVKCALEIKAQIRNGNYEKDGIMIFL
jgi:DNA-binding transcriptional MerR regulator